MEKLDRRFTEKEVCLSSNSVPCYPSVTYCDKAVLLLIQPNKYNRILNGTAACSLLGNIIAKQCAAVLWVEFTTKVKRQKMEGVQIDSVSQQPPGVNNSLSHCHSIDGQTRTVNSKIRAYDILYVGPAVIGVSTKLEFYCILFL